MLFLNYQRAYSLLSLTDHEMVSKVFLKSQDMRALVERFIRDSP
jgi:hypothetical protein